MIIRGLDHEDVTKPCYGRRRRKNRELFGAGRVTHLLVPSSVTLAVFVDQLAKAGSVPVCSKAKPAVSADGQETVISDPEHIIDSSGRSGR